MKRVSLAVAIAVGAIACLGVAQAGAAGSPSPPKIREPFSANPLPCTGTPDKRTTLQMEGCIEQDILKTDAKVESLDGSVFSLLGTANAQRKFVAGIRAWLAYRKADCISVATLYEGGSLETVVYGECLIGRNEQRIKDLRGLQKALRNR